MVTKKHTQLSHAHPDHSAQQKRINRIQGQLTGVAKMIEERRYCPDILQQTRAIHAALRALEAEVLKSHLDCCVREASVSKNVEQSNAKMEELLQIYKRG